MKALLTHPGTQYVHQLAKQLQRHGLLYRFCTSLALAKDSWGYRLYQLLPSKLQRKLSNRVISDVPSSSIINNLLLEYRSLRGLQGAQDKEAFFFERNEQFQLNIKNKWIADADVVIGFDTSSWILAARSQQLNRKFILDVSIAHSRSKERVFKGIAAKYPAWQFNIDHKPNDFVELECKEHALADGIVVASTFSLQSLVENGVPKEKIFLNPYGVNVKQFQPKQDYYRAEGAPIRFLFVGLVDARKGVPLLLDAIQQIDPGQVVFTFVGPLDPQVKQLIEDYGLTNINLIGRVPHSEVASYFNSHDVFVFPSYFEGFALVILEAMASGLPVITTDATIGRDCIEDGKDGFVLPAGNLEMLVNNIRYFIDQPSAIETMGRAAVQKAGSFSWDKYGERWANIIEKVLNKVQ